MKRKPAKPRKYIRSDLKQFFEDKWKSKKIAFRVIV